jgi:hypothetical protein
VKKERVVCVNWFSIGMPDSVAASGFTRADAMPAPTPEWLTTDLLVIVVALAINVAGIWIAP